MKTRINKKNETITITVNHDELTDIWLALDRYKYYLSDKKFHHSAMVVDNMYRVLIEKAVELGKIEVENGH